MNLILNKSWCAALYIVLFFFLFRLLNNLFLFFSVFISVAYLHITLILVRLIPLLSYKHPCSYWSFLQKTFLLSLFVLRPKEESTRAFGTCRDLLEVIYAI